MNLVINQGPYMLQCRNSQAAESGAGSLLRTPANKAELQKVKLHSFQQQVYKKDKHFHRFSEFRPHSKHTWSHSMADGQNSTALRTAD